MYKKIYVEITNNCNLNCPFCIHNSRKNKFMSIDEFKVVLNKLKKHTKYLYFHVLGEPLLHPHINEFIDLASEEFYINITTNGYLIDRIKTNKNIRQINISLHSYTKEGNKTLEEYMNDIFKSVDELKGNTYISYRLWAKNNYKDEIIAMLEHKYKVEIKEKTKLEDNVFIEFEHEFIWPDLENSVINEKGTCYALRDHLGILVDGTIVPCCLDSKGDIKLGNIFKDAIDEIQKSDKYIKMVNGFKENKKCEDLCKRCNFLE